jgi:Molybdopterin-binding domain of aldehyde dehydrogenase
MPTPAPTGCSLTWHTTGRNVAEVEIDLDTWIVQLVNYAAVDDVGTVIDPMIVEGQLNPPADPSMPRPVAGRSVPARSATLWLAVRNKYLAQINKSRRGTISRAPNGKTRYGSALLVFRFGGAELRERPGCEPSFKRSLLRWPSHAAPRRVRKNKEPGA